MHTHGDTSTRALTATPISTGAAGWAAEPGPRGIFPVGPLTQFDCIPPRRTSFEMHPPRDISATDDVASHFAFEQLSRARNADHNVRKAATKSCEARSARLQASATVNHAIETCSSLLSRGSPPCHASTR